MTERQHESTGMIRREAHRDPHAGHREERSAAGRLVGLAGRVAAGAGAAALAAAGSWWFYSRFLLDRHVPLSPALDAEQGTIEGAAGRLSYYADESGDGPPLLLVHSVNAAASSYEMLPLFERYRNERPVYALDLPGFGFSERSDRDYTPELYGRAIVEMLERIGRPADVIALSLGGEFAARASLYAPERFRSLTLLAPTGLGKERAQRDSLPLRVIQGMAGREFYDLVVSRPSLRAFSDQVFEGRSPRHYLRYAYSTSHQPGAHHAPLAFLRGRLFTPMALDRLYRYVDTPTLVIYGEQVFEGYDLLPDLLTPDTAWSAHYLSGTRAMPHFDRPVEVAGTLARFWRAAPSEAAVT